MVGGLVQNEQVDPAVHEHTKAQPGLLPAGQGGHLLEHVLPPELEGGQAVPRLLGGAVLGVEHGVHQVAVRPVKADDLGQVAGADGGPQVDGAGVRHLLPHDELDEGGFAGAVVPQQGDALPARHLQVNVLEQGARPKGLFQLGDHQGLVPVELPLAEAGGQPALLCGLVGGAHALDAPLHVDGPFVLLVVAFKCPQAHLLRRGLQLGDLGLLLLVLLEPLLIPALLFLHIEGVVAGVELRLSVLDFRHPFDHFVQKPAVVGDGQHRALEPLQIALQPLGGVQIQVVGGLVQQEDVGVLQYEPCQVDSGLFPAGQRVKGARAHIGPDAQAVANLVQPGLGVVSTPGLKSGGELVVPGHHLGVVPVGHFRRQLGKLRLHGVEGGEGRVQHIPHRIPFRVYRDLGDQPQPLARGDGNGTLVGVDLPGHHAENGGLARAVAAQQAHPLPLVDLEGEAVQNSFADLELLDQAGKLYVNHG